MSFWVTPLVGASSSGERWRNGGARQEGPQRAAGARVPACCSSAYLLPCPATSGAWALPHHPDPGHRQRRAAACTIQAAGRAHGRQRGSRLGPLLVDGRPPAQQLHARCSPLVHPAACPPRRLPPAPAPCPRHRCRRGWITCAPAPLSLTETTPSCTARTDWWRLRRARAAAGAGELRVCTCGVRAAGWRLRRQAWSHVLTWCPACPHPSPAPWVQPVLHANKR